jgi:hypothetical protein
MNMAKDMLRELGTIPFAATCMTKEALCRYMATQCIRKFPIPDTDKEKEYTPITLCLTELSHFLGGNSAHMIDFLTTIYDQEVYDAKTKNKGDDIIPGPYLTVLACTTPSNITRYLREDVISGGFSRRALFAFELDEGEPIAFPTVTPEAAQAWKACLEWGRKLESVAGEFKWSAPATVWYKHWYDDLFNGLKNHDNLMTRGYYKSKHIQLLKVAMLVVLGETTELVMDKLHLELSLEILNKLEKNLPKVFESMGRNELAPVAARVVELLDMAGQPVPEKKILSEFFRDADTKEIYGIIAHLVNTSKIVRIEEKNKSGQIIGVLLATPSIGQDWVAKQRRV